MIGAPGRPPAGQGSRADEMDEMLIQYGQMGQIFDCLSLGVIILTPDRRIAGFNRSAELLTGRREAEVLGRPCYRLFMDYLCGGRCKYLESGAESGDEVVTDVAISDLIDDSHSITRIESPIYDAGGRRVGCIEVFQDHSAFKELIQRIRFDDLKLKLILDNLDIGILSLDRGNHVSFFNKMAETITGYSRTETLGRHCERIIGTPLYRELSRCQREGRSNADLKAGIEGELVTKAGETIPVRTRYIPVENEEGRVVGGLATLSDQSLKYHLEGAIRDRYTCYDMVGKDPAMRKIFEILPVVAGSSATILIEGPTGTGKDLLAKIIHHLSGRAKQPFVKVNCASLPDNLLESEMFGYVKGAFTGAERDRSGRFRQADGGTIFLDEIGDLPLSLQAKLLRVLEDREFYPLGSEKTVKVDVRIISATNRNLRQLVADKAFRDDLFYRLNVMRLEIPPLAERKGDLPLLIPHILKRLSATREHPTARVTEDAMALLLNHDYPGNVRELENILEHALIICQDGVIDRHHLPVALLKQAERQGRPAAADLPAGERRERAEIIDALERHRWNRSRTAQSLEMDRSTLWRKMKKYHIDPDSAGAAPGR